MFYEPANISPAMLEKVDFEIKRIVDASYKEAVTLVGKHKIKLNQVAKALLIDETLDKEGFEKIVGKKP